MAGSSTLRVKSRTLKALIKIQGEVLGLATSKDAVVSFLIRKFRGVE